ncbi:MAG: MFS transporter [Phocaeicola sp.]|uniref:MFS transporter n=1 Tax=Phocaeicola sp. TaxID=2773926 RepID=UPI003F9F4A52
MTAKRIGMLGVIMMFWFAIAFISNILGAIIPDIIDNFHLKDLTLAGFIPTSFFVAYAVMSIPSGILVDKYGEKGVLLIGFILSFIGTLSFSLHPIYTMLLFSSFIIGIGMAMLQTVLNPLQRAVGGEENYAFVAEVAQFIFGIASALGPLAYMYLMHALSPSAYIPGNNLIIDGFAKLTPTALPWVALYWLFTIILFIMILLVLFIRFPKLETAANDGVTTASSYKVLMKQRYVWLFFLGIFCYVCSEQGISIYMSEFLEQYHGFDHTTLGASCVSLFWGLMMIGCIFGMILLKLVDSRKLLFLSGIVSIILFGVALFSIAGISRWAFPFMGFTISMMYSIVFSLALNTVSQHHGAFAGILCSALVGGAIGPLFISKIADLTSLRTGMMFIFFTLAYITVIGLWANPLINNKTVCLKQLFCKKN